MAWNGNFTSFPSTSIYSNDFNPFPEVEVKNNHHGVVEASSSSINKYPSSGPAGRKRRLTDEQIDSLERSFEEEIKLEPERKMRLSTMLIGLQPRQVAVWFQNRRARWRVKQIERLYDALKKEFDAVSKEHLKLQDEVMKLMAKLGARQAPTKQGSTGYTDV